MQRACYNVRQFIMKCGAKSCEILVSEKVQGQRAKFMMFVDSLMIHSGNPNYCVDTVVYHVLLRWDVLGIKVKIMLPRDPSSKIGSKKPMLDHVRVVEPKDEILPTTPILEQKDGHLERPAMLCCYQYPQDNRVSLAAGSGVSILLCKYL